MKVRFYQFSKRNKSTKLPDNVQYEEKDIVLKDKTSVTKPILLLQTFNAAAYNYFYIVDWNRYYFISDAQFIENMWEVAGTEDYLASHKAAIGLMPANVLYAAGSTKDIVDSRIPVKATVNYGHSTLNLGFTLSYANMRYILGITGKGSFGCYILENESDMSELLDGIDSWSSFITDNWTFTKQLFFGGSASECLRSALGIPISFSKSSHGTLEALSLGSYPCMDANDNPINGYKITDPILDYGGTITIPWIYNDWRNTSSYTDVCIYLPLIGLLNMPATEVKNEVGLIVDYKVNITSGDIAVEIHGSTTFKKYCTCSGNCAMPVAFGSTGIDTNKLTQAAVTGIGTIAAVSAATGGIGSILAGIEGGALLGNTVIGASLGATAMQTMQALGGNASGSAGLGGGASCALDSTCYCFVVSKELSDSQANFAPLIGKPYMGVATIGSFTGFVQTDGFQFESAASYSSERDMINRLLDSGIYYE